MGTQFSKIKVTQRVELHGEILQHQEGHYDTDDLPELFTRRAHHSGVISGHELLSYSFLGGSACEPRRSLRRKHRSKSLYSSFRSSASSSAVGRYILSGTLSEKDLNGGGLYENEVDLSIKDRSKHDSSQDSELDSGISVNVNYENAEMGGREAGGSGGSGQQRKMPFRQTNLDDIYNSSCKGKQGASRFAEACPNFAEHVISQFGLG